MLVPAIYGNSSENTLISFETSMPTFLPGRFHQSISSSFKYGLILP